MINYDFRGSSATAVELSGWRADVANIIRKVIGNRATLAICKLLPLYGFDKGLCVHDPKYMYYSKGWALCWGYGWSGFYVVKAMTAQQDAVLRTGHLDIANVSLVRIEE